MMSYLDHIQRLYVIDNSVVPDQQLIDQLILINKIEYVSNHGNKGIAQALNQGCNLALSDGFTWILTMDQDSSFHADHTSEFISLVDTFDKTRIDKIGIFSPNHITNNQIISSLIQPEYMPVKVAMTSGNILNLNAFSSTGDFKEELFIDYVDHEYCLRLRKNGYEILQCNKVHLQHNLGNSKHYRLLKITATHHNFIRRYYITRNRLHVIWLYKYFDTAYCGKEFFLLFTDVVKILIVEKGKLSKFRSVIRGIRDFIIDRYGPYQY